jgi:hypothetical protein
MAPIPTGSLLLNLHNRDNPNLICTQSTWLGIALFYIANYFAHCATVKSYPAETPRELAVAVVLALFLPSSGITRALDAIIRRSRFIGDNELERASRAGALCMVVRGPAWKPKYGDVLNDLHPHKVRLLK